MGWLPWAILAFVVVLSAATGVLGYLLAEWWANR